MNQETNVPKGDHKAANSNKAADNSISESTNTSLIAEAQSEDSSITTEVDIESANRGVSALIVEFKGKPKESASEKLDIQRILVAIHSMANPATEVECSEWLARTLTSREIVILKLSFGVEDGRPCSYREIGQRVGLSHQRIGQIMNKALAKLQAKRAEKAFPEGISSVRDLFDRLRLPSANCHVSEKNASAERA